mmetsp:Transcript_69731/g.186000  ORF Transcript_69731/g.186000 Transcript_69731/m.186000 type:complete len:115 (-) Transcript_69731:2-346(-)
MSHWAAQQQQLAVSAAVWGAVQQPQLTRAGDWHLRDIVRLRFRLLWLWQPLLLLLPLLQLSDVWTSSLLTSMNESDERIGCCGSVVTAWQYVTEDCEPPPPCCCRGTWGTEWGW